jgi:hypothetical protein
VRLPQANRCKCDCSLAPVSHSGRATAARSRSRHRRLGATSKGSERTISPTDINGRECLLGVMPVSRSLARGGAAARGAVGRGKRRRPREGDCRGAGEFVRGGCSPTRRHRHLYHTSKRQPVARYPHYPGNSYARAVSFADAATCGGVQVGRSAGQRAAPAMARPFGLSLHYACHLNCCSLRAELCDRTMLTRAGPLNFIASSRAFLMSFGSLTKAPKPPNASITLS